MSEFWLHSDYGKRLYYKGVICRDGDLEFYSGLQLISKSEHLVT